MEESSMIDLALITLDKSAVLNEHVQVACLPKRYSDIEGNELYGMGFRSPIYDSKSSISLKNIKLEIYPDEKCGIHDKVKFRYRDSHFCASNVKNILQDNFNLYN